MRIPFLAQTHESATTVQSTQRCVNMMFEQAPANGVSTMTLIPVPGEQAFTTAGPGGPARGAHVMAGVHYAVVEQALYRIDSDGTATNLGTVAGIERVRMDDNGTQLVIVADNNSYVYSTYSSSFAEIVHPSFLTASDVAFLDGYFIFAQKDTNQFFWSPLYDDLTGESDLNAFDATDRARALSSTGNIAAIISDHKELWIFKADTSAEVWQGISDPDIPFARLPNAYTERGCWNSTAVQKLDNTIFWLGDDKVVYRADGYLPMRVSHHGIERAIAEMADINDMFTIAWEEAGHKLFGMWFPKGQRTFVYDVSTNMWHERQSESTGYWRVNSIKQCYDSLIITDGEVNQIGKLDESTFTEYGSTKSAYMIGPTLHAEGAQFSVDRLEVLCETGVGDELGSEPGVTLIISKDFGRTWGTPKVRSLGKRGEYTKRCVWRQLGIYRQMTPKIRFTNAVRRYVLDAYAELSPRRI